MTAVELAVAVLWPFVAFLALIGLAVVCGVGRPRRGRNR